MKDNTDIFLAISEYIIAKGKMNRLAGIDLSRNYLYREILTEESVKKFDKSYHNTTMDHEGSHGDDFKNSRTNRGEDKSSQEVKVCKRKNNAGKININACQFQFDKCNDKIKQNNMLGIGAYSFGFYDKDDKLYFIAYINTPTGILYINEKIKQKINTFMNLVNECEKKNKRLSRDTIMFSGKEIIECPEAVFINNEGNLIHNIKDLII